MIKIMIVDDVPIFLEYLRGCIDWASYGFEICAEAGDGREALAKIDEYLPDIVLTDITMPHVNGLELAERIMKDYPDIAVILITGNNEFEYARKAVKLGVCDYIVKPFEKEELILSLLKLQDNISLALEAKNEREAIEYERRETALRKLTLGRDVPGYDYNKRLVKEGIEFGTPYFLVCIMKFGESFADKLETLDNWESIFVPMIRNKIALEDGLCAREVFRDFENNVVIVLNFESEEKLKSYKTYELSDLSKVVKEQLGYEATIGISEYCYGLEAVSKGYSQALMANKAGDDGYFSWETVDKLTKAMEILDEQAAVAIVRSELERVRNVTDKNYVITMYSGLISILLTHLVKSGRSVEDIFGKDFTPYSYIKKAEEGIARENAIIDCFKMAINYRRRNSDDKARTVAENAKEYVGKNYSDPDMSVTDIARELLINQTYLRSMFKQETGMTLSEYITQYRMNLAREMIIESKFKISEIAEKVGYNDVSYFSKSFKKYFGVTPKNVG